MNATIPSVVDITIGGQTRVYHAYIPVCAIAGQAPGGSDDCQRGDADPLGAIE